MIFSKAHNWLFIVLTFRPVIDFQEVGCGYIDGIGLAQDRDRWRTLVSAVMNFRIP